MWIEQQEFVAKYARWYVKQTYHPIFAVPDEPWKVDASWRDAYFHASKEIVQRVVDGELMPAIHGIAGIFLFRHYVELALKYIVGSSPKSVMAVQRADSQRLRTAAPLRGPQGW